MPAVLIVVASTALLACVSVGVLALYMSITEPPAPPPPPPGPNARRTVAVVVYDTDTGMPILSAEMGRDQFEWSLGKTRT